MELGLIYSRLLEDLRSIHTPEDLLKPFMQKTVEIKTAIKNLEAMTMVFMPSNRAPGSIETTPESLLTSPEVEGSSPQHWHGVNGPAG